MRLFKLIIHVETLRWDWLSVFYDHLTLKIWYVTTCLDVAALVKVFMSYLYEAGNASIIVWSNFFQTGVVCAISKPRTKTSRHLCVVRGLYHLRVALRFIFSCFIDLDLLTCSLRSVDLERGRHCSHSLKVSDNPALRCPCLLGTPANKRLWRLWIKWWIKYLRISDL